MRRPTPEIERVWTIRDLITWGQEYFESKGVDSPRLTIDLLLCAVLGISRLDLYMQHDRPLTKDELKQLRGFVTRRSQREPLQYILGHADFFGLQFAVTPAVLIPRPETEILVDRCIRWITPRGELETRGLDIGTGSGCIPVTIAHHCRTSTWMCVDKSHDALDVAHSNAIRHGVDDRCTMQQMDFLEAIPLGAFDVVTMNPPYIAPEEIDTLDEEVRGHEPRMALTDEHNGETFFIRFAEVAAEILTPDGRAFLEIGFGQAERISTIFTSRGLSCHVIDDLAGIPRVLEVFRGHVTST
jgi:release factor glutamine methyltransferase